MTESRKRRRHSQVSPSAGRRACASGTRPFSCSAAKRTTVSCSCPSHSLETNLLPGNELRISVEVPGTDKPWAAKGLVTRITEQEEICLEVRENKVPT